MITITIIIVVIVAVVLCSFYIYKKIIGARLRLVVSSFTVLNDGLNLYFFSCHVFIGPLFRGSNRYQNVRAKLFAMTHQPLSIKKL